LSFRHEFDLSNFNQQVLAEEKDQSIMIIKEPFLKGAVPCLF
jgi:hypothetical protein